MKMYITINCKNFCTKNCIKLLPYTKLLWKYNGCCNDLMILNTDFFQIEKFKKCGSLFSSGDMSIKREYKGVKKKKINWYLSSFMFLICACRIAILSSVLTPSTSEHWKKWKMLNNDKIINLVNRFMRTFLYWIVKLGIKDNCSI